MSNLLVDDTNYALEPNVYLEKIKNETNREKIFQILKKYFTENITKNLYQNMDLLNTTPTDFEQFKSLYVMIAKDMVMNTLLAVTILVKERNIYELNADNINVFNSIVGITNTEQEENEYSICEACIMSSDF